MLSNRDRVDKVYLNDEGKINSLLNPKSQTETGWLSLEK